MKLDFRTKLFMTFTISTLLIAGNYRGYDIIVAFVMGLIPFLLFLIDGKLKTALVGGAIYILIFSISEFSLVGTLPTLNFIILIIISRHTANIKLYYFNYQWHFRQVVFWHYDGLLYPKDH